MFKKMKEQIMAGTHCQLLVAQIEDILPIVSHLFHPLLS
jgi:hypothetical protein